MPDWIRRPFGPAALPPLPPRPYPPPLPAPLRALHTRERVWARVARVEPKEIRFVPGGLGEMAGREFGGISPDGASAATVSGVQDLAAGIAGMAASLKSRTGSGSGA